MSFRNEGRYVKVCTEYNKCVCVHVHRENDDDDHDDNDEE